MAVLGIGIVPVPFQVAMLAAGASGYPFPLFMLAAMLGRGVRYFGLAVLVALVGNPATSLWQRYARTLGILGILLFAAWGWYEISTW